MTNSNAAADNLFIRVSSAPEMLAERLREGILRGDFPEGEAIASERGLMEKSGLSRASVREALRILETEGLLEIRPGRNGGAVVRQPDSGSISKMLGVYIRGRRIGFGALVEARQAIEEAAVRLAAMRRTDEDLATLREISKRLEASADLPDVLVEENVRWHLAVAQASHNELLYAVMVALSRAINNASRVDLMRHLMQEGVKEAFFRAHRRIQKAIEDRDPEAAVRRMHRHLAAYVEVSGIPADTELES